MLPNYQYYITKLIYSILLCLVLNHSIKAQQFNNWYFPNKNGITFNTNPYSAITNSQLDNANFSCASISDKNGNLLFYSNGINVWDKNNQLMPNGFGLKGEHCQINGVIIIPFLNDTSKYYLFTSQGLTFLTTQPDTFRYSYSVIDMQLNNGFGDVINKNIDIRGFATEKMTAVPHANGNDIWWICRDWTNHFYSYKITCTGLQISNPVVSTVGNNVNFSQNLLPGDIKVSPDGNYIAACYKNFALNPGYFEIYKFNKSTGILSEPIRIPAIESYGVEFSPNSKVLYITQLFVAGNQTDFIGLTQYDLSIYDSTFIQNSMKRIAEIGITGLQLGPDNKIYAPVSFTNSNLQVIKGIDVINNPNTLGLACNYQSQVINLPNLTSRRLPYAPPFLITSPNVQIPTYTVASDCRTVTLTGKTYIKGNNLTFKWKFGDGDSTIQTVASMGDTTFTSVTHTYPLGVDTFNVQLFVTSDTVCGIGSAGKKVILKPPKPTAKFGFTTTCNNLLVNFYDSSLLNFNPSLNYQWQFLTKNNVLLGSSMLQNPSFSFPAFDTFSVRLIVRSNLACVPADTLVKHIVLKAKPTASFTYTNNCGSVTAAFTNTSAVLADTLFSYYWSFGGGFTSTAKNPSFNFGDFTTYPVKLVVSSSLGCVSDTFSLPVVIKAKPVANFMYNNNGCVGAPLLLQDSSYVLSSSIANWFWQLPNGSSFTSATINPVFASANNYTIKHVVRSAQGCISDTLFKSVLIESNPIAAIAPFSGGCVNTPVSFTSNSSIALGGIKQYRWKFTATDSISLTASTANFSFTNAANYAIEHYVVSNNGCISNKVVAPISIHSKPVAAFSNGLVCVGKPINFSNESSNSFGAIVNSAWRINNTLVSNNNNGFAYTFNQAGNYAVGLTVSTANGCSTTLNKTIGVDAALANAGKDTTVREGEPFVLNGSGGVNYFWQPPVGLNNINIANPTGVLNNSQQYIVKVTTAQGCIGFDTVIITVLRNLKIPNAFSPNGDGINDTWMIEQLKDYLNATVQIFNRNGQLVYNAKGNTITAWNATNNNKPLPVGTYYYIINLNTPLRSKPITGWVVVVR